MKWPFVSSPESVRITADLINRYPDRFCFGSDEVAPATPEKYLKIYYQYDPLWKALTQEASVKVRKTDYEQHFDEATRRVRNWEKATRAEVTGGDLKTFVGRN